ncbi:hypothetical protein B296_00035985 [Ensete ventricosum]|uniref:Uncharacterized protein n=1 Tax=Ensete ventricosum TaxID=4639 RepID=A0A427A3Z8_ENSVE|nr:hypothetical protein B296_00035985 [Ensete ventricosum]
MKGTPKKIGNHLESKRERVHLCTRERIAADPRPRGREERAVVRSKHEERREGVDAANHDGNPLEGAKTFAAAPTRLHRGPGHPSTFASSASAVAALMTSSPSPSSTGFGGQSIRFLLSVHAKRGEMEIGDGWRGTGGGTGVGTTQSSPKNLAVR